MNLIEKEDGIIGFRPEHMAPKDGAECASGLVDVPFRVSRIEYLGADELVYGVLEPPFPEEKIIAKVPSAEPFSAAQGQSVVFTVKQTDVKCFDRETGLRTDMGGSGS